MAVRCNGCMKLKQQRPVCEHCGYNENVPNYPHQLPIGTLLKGQYLVGKVLGQGGFGITYMGWDTLLENPIAIKEYYPNSFVNRDCSVTTEVVCAGDGAKELFAHNRDRFLQEAKILAKLQNIPGIVRVQNLCEENNTAYIIMEYVEGIDLKQYIRLQNRVLTAQEMFHVLRPVMYALSKVHEAELVHRDISPDNIMILPDGTAKLLDFGAAREVENAQVDKDLPQSTEAILKHGFAPMEQYRRRGSLGPWTDVYALCATMYYCLTGRVPNSAPEWVMGDDNVNWRQIPGLTEQQIATLEKGLALMPENRIRTMRELHTGLFGQSATDFTQVEPKPESDRRGGSSTLPKSAETQQKKPEKKPDYPTHTVSLESDDAEANRRGGSSTLPKAATTEQKKKKPIGLIAAALAVVAAVGIFALKPKEEVGTVAGPEEKPAISETEPAIVVTLSEEEKQYLAAEELEAAGEYGKAAIAFGKLGDYADARERSFALWDKNAVRQTISAGMYYTIGLHADGTVVATGSNYYGQCDVSNWDGIAAVSAGDQHAVGLRADGTVVATGYNENGACDVSTWNNIVAIDTGDFHTIGLCADGTVLATGFNEDSQCDVSNWGNIVTTSAGLWHTVGLCVDGTVVAAGNNEYRQCDVSAWNNIVAISAGTCHTVGLRNDGTVVATGHNYDGQCDVSNWKDIVAISAGAYYTLGLCGDGTVVVTGNNEDGQCNVRNWNNIVAISADDFHTIGLRADGTMLATGYNEYGQCNVGNWKDIRLPMSREAMEESDNLMYGIVSLPAGTDEVNMRSGPGTSYSIVAAVPESAECEILAQEEDWYKVRYNNMEGYIHSNYLEPTA